MTTFQIVALIIGCLLIAVVILSGLFSKDKNTLAPDMQLAVDSSPAPTEELPAMVTHPVIDQDALMLWYQRETARHEKLQRRADLTILIYFVAQGVAFAIAIITWMVADEETRNSLSNMWTMIAVLGVLYLYVLYNYYVNKNKSIAKTLTSKKYVELAETQFPSVWASCKALQWKMNLTGYRLRIFYMKTDAFEASVVLEDGDIYLFVSRSLLSYFYGRPKDVESILGHEFGHMVQGDTKMLLVNRDSIAIPGIIQTISLVLLLIEVGIALYNGSGMPQIAGSFALASTYWQLVKARKRSEYLADMASLIYVDNSTIVELIQKYMPESGNFDYPSRKQRLAFIENTMKQFTSTETKEVEMEAEPQAASALL